MMIRQASPSNVNQTDSASTARARHKPTSTGPISTIVTRLSHELRDALDRALMQDHPDLIMSIYDKLRLEDHGISLSAVYRYARRLRLHAAVHDNLLLECPDARSRLDALCLQLDARFLDRVDRDEPPLEELQRIASIRRMLTASHLQDVRSQEFQNRTRERNQVEEATRAIDNYCVQVERERRLDERLRQSRPDQKWNPNITGEEPTPTPATPPLTKGGSGGS